MNRERAVDIICFLFIVLFVYAGLSKLLDVETFRLQIGHSPPLTGIAPFLAWFIPSAEILISLMLAIQVLRLPGLYAAFSLMVVFTVYIASVLRFSDDIPCSCGGVLQRLGWTEHLIFNCAFIVLALTGVLFETRSKRRKRTPRHTPDLN